ncbi:hypothetical protein [Actinoplanes sp. NBRC 103695]|uniref:hypothetical protein n=1 Tax=Actinoplanes sp. NBRC 103695 TaxID=3032202 RepID=UPI0024A3998D|nr:hypothetical protein [Actinoplanes sp. NBRC 103695]GLZ01039.1 hypothetical protein Acsp02_82900 [Actinoplanes sp. NBRC 103695]
MSGEVTTPADLAGGAYEGTVRQQAKKLHDELIKQTIEDMESWMKAVENEWAQAHPGEQMGPPIPPEEVQGYRVKVQNEYFEWVIPAFEQRLKPDPDDLDPVIDTMRTIEGMFEGSADTAGNFTGASAALGRINDVRVEMAGWEGTFKDNFIDNFLTPLQSVVPNQRKLLSVVRGQLECNKIIYVRYRKAVVELLKKSIDAVQMLNNARDPKSELWGTLVACAIGTALGAVTGGWGLAATAVLLDAGGTLAQGLLPDPPPTNDLSAPTAAEVAVKISEALNKLDADTYEQERMVADALNALGAMLEDNRATSIKANTPGAFSVAEPKLNEATPGQITGGSFRPAT